MSLSDTIVALATPPGVGATALVRMSGPEADGFLRALTGGMQELPEPRRATLLALSDPETRRPLDRAVVTRFPAPESYTGETVVEISTHGGWWIPAQLLEACRALGARGAEPGEFTRRAYLHGKMDLIQVEGVADLVGARSTAAHEAALDVMERGLSRRITELREALVGLEAHLAHHLDFPEEDDAPVPLEEVRAQAREVAGGIRRLLATAPQGALLREGAVTVLAGPPNAGKSSLYNALVGETRAIVTEIPGTTRDALEEVVELEGYPFRLVDTAGLRDTEDQVERMGIEVARAALARADLVLFCRSAGDESEAPGWLTREASGAPLLELRTKADLASSRPRAPGEITVSVETGAGLDALRERMVDMVYGGLVAARGEAVVMRRRQRRALDGALEALVSFDEALENRVPADMAAAHLGVAEVALEELLGVISVDDVLDVVFSSFCVGK